MAKTGLWKLSTRLGKVTSIGIYKDSLGRKSIASGTDGTRQGLADYIKMKNADIKYQRAWAEVSGAPEASLRKAGGKPIPNKYASILTGKELLDLNPDGIHYTRLISGHPHEKVIYGFITLDDITFKKLQDAGIDVNNLPDNMKPPK